jgi:hypothetical protein
VEPFRAMAEAATVELRVQLSAAQARWLSDAAEQTGETESELVRQAIQLLRKASAYGDEVP